jgi:hypothetical protein
MLEAVGPVRYLRLPQLQSHPPDRQHLTHGFERRETRPLVHLERIEIGMQTPGVCAVLGVSVLCAPKGEKGAAQHEQKDSVICVRNITLSFAFSLVSTCIVCIKVTRAIY